MDTSYAEALAHQARAVCGLLNSHYDTGAWSWAETGMVVSDFVTIDLDSNRISYRTNGDHQRTDVIELSAGTTLGTYAAIARGLHELHDDRAAKTLDAISRSLGELARGLSDWQRLYRR